MGYCADSIESDVLILKKNFESIVSALAKNDLLSHACSNSIDVNGAFRDLGFSIDCDEEGNIDNLYFDACRYHDDVGKMVDVIAPFVEEGSYIAFRGEDGCHWAFYWDGNTCEEFYGEVNFPGMSTDGPRRR